MSQRKRATVLIIDAQSTRSIGISHTALKAIKPALWLLSISTTVLAVSLAYLAHQHMQTRSQAEQLAAEVTQLQNLTSAEIETKLQDLSRSEASVAALQQYLKARGVNVPTRKSENRPGQPLEAAGGPEIKLSAPLPYAQAFSEETDKLLQLARTIPLGKPHGGTITSEYGVRPNPFSGRGSEFHNGLDFRGNIGEPVYSTADGVVVFSGSQNGYGLVVKIRHGHGYQTVYAHLSAIDVADGQKVKAGQAIGKLGNTGRSTGPHLHYEVRRHEETTDPEQFLSLNIR